jgi:hypothetical protein
MTIGHKQIKKLQTLVLATIRKQQPICVVFRWNEEGLRAELPQVLTQACRKP